MKTHPLRMTAPAPVRRGPLVMHALVGLGAIVAAVTLLFCSLGWVDLLALVMAGVG